MSRVGPTASSGSADRGRSSVAQVSPDASASGVAPPGNGSPKPSVAAEAAPPALPRLADGAKLAGEFQGSGYREPPHLVSRGDGQLVRLPALLYAVVEALHKRRKVRKTTAPRLLDNVAKAVSQATGLGLTADHIAYLLDKKLAPLGVTTYSDGGPPQLTKANPFLALRWRTPVISERGTWRLAGLFTLAFNPHIACILVTIAVCAEMLLFATQDMGLALQLTLQSPPSVLAVLGLTLASAAFHEVGHATACRYGGVRPGVMGCGIYLVWPAFYTDITNSYRLNRAGRLRADLGGVYFNALFLIGLATAYWYTGYTPLLVAILATNLEIFQQLLPTLRFDGYYIVADLVGVPDLFKYIGPILKRTFLRHAPDHRLALLKRWPQLVVSTWVTLVIPLLLVQLAYLAFQMPGVLRALWFTVRNLAATATGSSGFPLVAIISASLQIVVLLIPVVGLALMAGIAARRVLRLATGRTSGYVPRHAR